MKKFLMNMVIDIAFDAIVKSLSKLAQKSSTKLDNKMVALVRSSKAEIIADIKRSV